MAWYHGVREWLWSLLRRGRAEREMAEEFRFHLERETEKNLALGMSPAEARRAALITFGGVERFKEEVREARGRLLDDLVQDIRIGLRGLRKSPGFTAVALISMALGVGANSAIFSVVHAVLLEPLPYADADRLVQVRIDWPTFDGPLSNADMLAWSETSDRFAAIGAFAPRYGGFTLQGGDEPAILEGAWVSRTLPATLGVSPILGRLFDPGDESVALISQRFWEERLGASPAALGSVLEVDGMRLTVVGVMPEGFVTPGAEGEVIWPLLELDEPQRRGPFYLFAVGRLGEGMSLADAREDLDRTRVALNESYPEEDWRYDVRPLRDAVVGDVRTTLWLLMAAVSLVLIIAVANVANLLLSRATVRVREVAVRSALGARPSRLVRQLLTESAILGLLGALAGLGLAYGGVALIGEIGASFVPRIEEVEVNSAVLGFTLAVGLGAGLAAGIAPALQSPWRRIAALVREAGRSSTIGGGSGHLRYGLVVAEFALALTVISAAGLLTRSLMRIEREELGYRTEDLVSFSLHLPEAKYSEGERLMQFLDRLEERLGELPSVRGVGFSMSLPPTELSMTNNYTVHGQPPRTRGSQSVAEWTQVSESYFATLGIPLLSGRVFETSDAPDAPAVVVVNAAFVRRHFPDGSAVGERIQGGSYRPDGSWSTIVGVVGDVPYAAGAAGGMQPTVYTPYRQQAWWQRPWVSIWTRPGADAARVLDAARTVVRELEPGVPFRQVATMEQRVERSQTPARFRSLLFALLAAVALGLATTGIFGVMAYTIDQRRRETAIRMALGADAGRTMREVLGKAARVSSLGLAAGLAAALVATRSLSPVLYETDPLDLTTFLGGAVLLFLVALAASWIPTLAALRTDPASTLRED